MPLKILELFSGTASFSKVARERGHEVFTIDNDKQFNPDLCKNILDVTPEDIPFKPDIIWASPPCTVFSMLAVYRNWEKIAKGFYKAKREEAIEGCDIVLKTMGLIKILKPKFWFIENPRGMLRVMPFMKNLDRKSITYCQYGDTRMKPTDIWTNCLKWHPKTKCKNGDPCHERVPRGSALGTQGMKNAKDRAVIPPALCLEIIKVCEVWLVSGS